MINKWDKNNGVRQRKITYPFLNPRQSPGELQIVQIICQTCLHRICPPSTSYELGHLLRMLELLYKINVIWDLRREQKRSLKVSEQQEAKL